MGKINNTRNYPLRTPVPLTKLVGSDPVNGNTYNYLVKDLTAGGTGFITLTGLGNPSSDFDIFQDALDEASAEGKGVYIPYNEHLKLTDFPIFPDNAILINDGIYENVTTSESYAFQGCLFGLGRIAQSDFWPDPNTIGTVLSASGNRILFSSVTNASWFTSYASKTGLKETRVFFNDGEGNPAANPAYLSAIGNNGSNYYIDLEDGDGNPINATVEADDTIDLMDTILVNNGFLNQQGVNVFKLQPAYRGNRVVLTDSGAGTNFTVGETVFLKGAGSYIARYTSDRAFTPYYSHIDIVEAIDGDVITLAIGVHDLGAELTDLELCKFTNLRTVATDHPSGGISPNAISNVYIGGNGKFIQNVNRSVIAFAGGAMIDCTFDINELEGGGFTTNSFCRSTAKINSLTSPNTIVSLALGSCDFDVSVNLPRLVKDSGEGSAKTSRTVIFPHENIVNGKIVLGTITTSYDYPLAINVLEMDCMGVEVDYAFEIGKREQVETPSFGNGIRVRSQDPQLLGDARGYHGKNRIKQRAGSSPYVAQVLGIDSAINDYEEQPSEYDIQYSGAFGEGVVIGDYGNKHSVKIDFNRYLRQLFISDLESLEDKTVVTFSGGDTRQFTDGQSVEFDDIESADWLNLNTGSYDITRIVSDTQIEIDFDSSTYPVYSATGDPYMIGAEGVAHVSTSSSSYQNDIVGYVDNKVDTSISGAVVSNLGNNVVSVYDSKSLRIASKVSRANLSNTGNSNATGLYTARPAAGYVSTTAGKLFTVGGFVEYPSLQQATSRFSPVRLTSSSCLLTSNGIRSLKVGDTFNKTIKGTVYGTYAGQKTILDTYRWLDALGNTGYVEMPFNTNISSGDSFIMTTYVKFSAGNYLTAWATFDDGTFTKQSFSKVIAIPQAVLNNHLCAYFDSSFNPLWTSYDDVVTYEETFLGEDITENTKDRIVIESIDFNYERN